jgi:hypothetical protein
MSYEHAEVVWRVTNGSRDRGLELLARRDGLFEFREHQLVEDEHPVDGVRMIWIAGYSSGLFETSDQAKREARAVIGWLGGA